MPHVEIVPAILANNSNEFQRMLRLVESHVEWVHVDVMDGKFVPNTTWNNPNDLMRTRTNVAIEVHLMVEEPEMVYRDWILAGARRVIWHYEATQKHHEIATDIRARGAAAGIALNPETSLDAIAPFLSEIDIILIMANTPGLGGQEFQDSTLEKIRALRELWPDGMIGVDIGINPETAKKAVGAGVNVLVAGSYIFGSENPVRAVKELQTLLL